MPKDYVLKNSPIDQNKINRLIKTVQGNAEGDRIRANAILERVEAELNNLALVPEELTDNNGNSMGWVILGLDNFTKLVQSACATLATMGANNDRLIKLAALLQKFLSEGGSKHKENNATLFAQLKRMADNDDEES